ncbi:MAG: class IV adenylate cyclase [Candidatus Bathyarchaeia archaeon]
MVSRNPKAQHALVELKAKATDLAGIRKKLTNLGAEQVGIFHQTDTYYLVPKGRLKLREVEGKAEAELIYYEREDTTSPKRSSVSILSIPNPQTLKRILGQILQVKAVVDKVREIYVHEGTQVHLDVVKGLGSFIEFERITTQNAGQQEKDLARLERLRQQMGISSESLERLSYSDLT